jgi:hypothetical protein
MPAALTYPETELITDETLPSDEYGPTQMFNVPNPPSDVAENVASTSVIEAIDRHAAASRVQFGTLPTAIQQKIKSKFQR